MTTEEQKSTFNIFQILSAGDKELVHSSMIKFLLEESSSFREKFLDDEYPELYIKLEISDTVSDNSRNKRLRFDLLGYDKPDDGKLLFAIENKFKSTPSVHQLKLYDKYFNENKNNLHSNFTKFLIVFSEDQIPSDVRKYCDDSNSKWVIRPFFSFEQKNPNLLNFLQNQTFKSSLQNPKGMFLIKEYKEYLESIYEILNHYMASPTYYSYNTIINTGTENPIFAPRFIGFQYLLHIQALISKSDLIKNWIEDSQIKMYSSNDGGSNVIPSVAFWLNENKSGKKFDFAYFGIDGDSIKVGFLYKKTNSEITAHFIESIELNVNNYKFLELIKKIEPSKGHKLKKLNQDEINDEKMMKSQSVCSIYTFKAKKEQTKDNVVNDCIRLAYDFFTEISNI